MTTASPTDNELMVWRLVLPSLLDALSLIATYGATPARIDAACRDRSRPGPIDRLRLDGAALWLTRLESVRASTRQSPRFEARSLLVALVADPLALDGLMAPSAALDPDSTVSRLDLAIINEAYRMVGEGVADPTLLDACLRDLGWPGGPFEMAGTLGLRAVIDGLGALAASDDATVRDRFLVAPLLWQIATV